MMSNSGTDGSFNSSVKSASRNSIFFSPAVCASERAPAMWVGLKSAAKTLVPGLAAATTFAVESLSAAKIAISKRLAETSRGCNVFRQGREAQHGRRLDTTEIMHVGRVGDVPGSPIRHAQPRGKECSSSHQSHNFAGVTISWEGCSCPLRSRIVHAEVGRHQSFEWRREAPPFRPSAPGGRCRR